MRIEKTYIVEELQQRYQDSALLVLTTYHGLSADQLGELRSKIADSHGTFSVVKNRLLKRALPDSSADEFDDLLLGPNAVAATTGDVVSLAKALKDYSKQHSSLEIRGGLLDMSTVLTAEQINELAALPSREVLLSRLIGTMQGPVRGLVTIFSTLLGNTVRALDQIAKLKAEAAPAVEAPAEQAQAEAAPAAEAPAEEAQAEAAPAAEAPAEEAKSETAPAEEAPAEEAGVADTEK